LSSKVIPKDRLGPVRKVDLSDVPGALRTPNAPGAAAREAVQRAAQTQIQQVREQAYREGLQAGREEAQALAEQQRAEVQALIAGVNQLMQDFEQTLASDVLSISLELTKLILRQAVRVNLEVVLPVVREAIANLPGVAEPTVIALNPADAALLRKLADGEPALAALPWKIVEDVQIERGGCRLETPSTEIDATLETRWRRVIAALGRDDPWIEITV
jgi:flagellar assembly protein FliH